MIGKLVASALAGSNVGKAIGPILNLAAHVESAMEAGADAPKGVLQSMVDWISGGGGTPATAVASAGGGTVPLPSGGIPFIFPMPNVGGVLFDKAAECLTDLEEITGAYWDDRLGQVVLTGKKNGKAENVYLPKMDKDHFAVALRAAFSDDNLGVSIDPPPGYIESGKLLSDGTPMDVRYLGNTKDTLFGAIIFEADRLLKTLSMGKDNISHDPITSNVSGFQNELELYQAMGTERQNTWHRMWYVIEDVKLHLPVMESADRKAIKFGKVAINVKADSLTRETNPNANPGVDPVAARFAEHFTLHYDDFAKEFPILERLKDLAKISAVAKWLRNSGKPVDLSFLNNYEFIRVPTPETTPGIIASKSRSWQSGSAIHTQINSLCGGVDFDFQYHSIKDDLEAPALRKIAQDSKPCETLLEWDFKFKGEFQRALAFPVSGRNGNYAAIHTDFSLTSNDGLKLEMARCYDSFDNKPSILGYGWNLKIPYEIFTINAQKADSSLLLIDRMTGKSNKYIFVDDKKSYFQVSGEREESGKTSFSYNPQKFINKSPDSSFIWKAEDGITYNFNPQGKLIFMTDRNNRRLNYNYERNRVIGLSDSSGKSIRLIYDRKNRLKQAVCPGQRIINYEYGPSGDLIRVDNGEDIKNYVYDANHRMVKAFHDSGKVIARHSYDPLGRVITKRQDTVTDPLGNLIVKTYDENYRLIREEDREGNSIAYQYDRDNNITKSILTDKLKRATLYEYDKHERMRKVVNSMNQSIEIGYNTTGNIVSFVDANNNVMKFNYDENGNLIAFEDAMGNHWKQEFDHLSRLRGIIDPHGNKIEFEYANGDNRLRSVSTPEGSTRYQYDKRGRLSKLIDPNGNTTEYIYDSKSKIVGVKDALERKWSFQ